jgi:hypothetical protein
MAAGTPISAVSGSRISPIMTTSGSSRRIERSAAAKVTPACRCTGTCVMPLSWYSIGASTVTIFSRVRSRWARQA